MSMRFSEKLHTEIILSKYRQIYYRKLVLAGSDICYNDFLDFYIPIIKYE